VSRPAVAIALLLGVAASLGLAWPTAAMPDAVRIPIVTPAPGRIPAAAALFRHGTHGQFTCYACHPSLFPKERVGFTHADMQTGRFCAACHDGAGAFAIADAPCERCHVPK
jgi:c(7)-type cytochrome triheme protein